MKRIWGRLRVWMLRKLANGQPILINAGVSVGVGTKCTIESMWFIDPPTVAIRFNDPNTEGFRFDTNSRSVNVLIDVFG